MYHSFGSFIIQNCFILSLLLKPQAVQLSQMFVPSICIMNLLILGNEQKVLVEKLLVRNYI